MKNVKKISHTILADLLKTAEKSDRKRAHHLLHPSHEDPVQRLCISGFKGTYIRPHNHFDPEKWELFIATSGKAILFIFDEKGVVKEKHLISGDNMPACAVEIPPGVWHNFVITSEAAHLIEVKPGPFVPIGENGFAHWAPAEGEPEAKEFVTWLESASIGDRWK